MPHMSTKTRRRAPPHKKECHSSPIGSQHRLQQHYLGGIASDYPVKFSAHRQMFLKSTAQNLYAYSSISLIPCSALISPDSIDILPIESFSSTLRCFYSCLRIPWPPLCSSRQSCPPGQPIGLPKEPPTYTEIYGPFFNWSRIRPYFQATSACWNTSVYAIVHLYSIPPSANICTFLTSSISSISTPPFVSCSQRPF